LGLEFVEPLRSAVESLSVLSFNVDVHRTECLLGQVATKSFVVRHLLAPVAAVYMLIVTVPRRWVRTEVRLIAEVLNVVGSVYQIAFVSLVLSVVAPSICFRGARRGSLAGARSSRRLPEHEARGIGRGAWLGAVAGARARGARRSGRCKPDIELQTYTNLNRLATRAGVSRSRRLGVSRLWRSGVCRP